MLNVPRVTMNGGRLRPTTRPPLTKPTIMQVATPSRIAISGGTPESTASLVITIDPSAIAVPHDRSMPAVRMISVWPMASVPTTITCWMISEKFLGSRNWSDCVVKKMQASSRANSGPSCATPLARHLRHAALAGRVLGGAAGGRPAACDLRSVADSRVVLSVRTGDGGRPGTGPAADRLAPAVLLP